MLRLGRYLSMVGVLLVVCGLPSGGWAQEKRIPVKVEGKTVIPLRVLTRPFSNIYKEPDESKAKVEENVPTFKPFYVYTCPEVKATATEVKGWYEVGSDNRGTVLGWMKADDVLAWKQNMTLAYTHPDGRKPVLMFENREALLALVKAPSDQRKQRADEFYAAIQAKKIPADFPVRSVEPNGYIDLGKQFYLLPILEFGESGLDQYETRILKLAAAVLQGADARGDQSVINRGKTDVQTRQAMLESERARLQGLDDELARLQQNVNKYQARNNAQQAEKQRLGREIKRLQGQIVTLRNSQQLAQADKEKQIASLRREIDELNQLALQLK